MSNTPAEWPIESSAFAESPTHGEIYPDLIKAFGDLANVATDQQAIVPTKAGGTYSYKYMSLGAIMAATRGPLAGHNLAIMQAPTIIQDGAGRSVEISTRLIHQSGEWIETRIAIAIAAGADAQAVGSAMTYARRYGLTALLGIASGDDDDGRAAADARPGDYEQPHQNAPIAGAKSRILELIEEHGGSKADAAAFWHEVVNSGQPDKEMYSIAGIEAFGQVAPQWIEGRTPQAPSDAPDGAEPGEGAQSPPDDPNAPQTGAEGEAAGTKDRAAKARADVDLEVAQHLGVDVDQIISEIQHMNVPDVRLKLSQAALDSRGNADQIRRRLAEVLIREAIDAAKAATADQAPFADAPENTDEPES